MFLACRRPSGRVSIAGLIALIVLPASAAAADPSILNGLEWRLLGPHRGGWATMATGVAEQPDTFYFGAAGGGVWRSRDAGATWESIDDGLDDAAIGAIAVSASNPDILYAGSGHPEPRYDIQSGNGLYKSADGGQHWRNIGLRETRHIGAILIDPKNPDTVLVGALGHMFGPNPDRGVFRSTDGGQHWTKTLYVDDQTGVVDLAADPADPASVYAATWTARDWPWLSYFTPIEGEGSAVWHSGDGGQSWARVGGEGWPSGKLGRIGLAVAHLDNGATRLYASIDSAAHAGLYRSDDGGAHWQRVNDASAVSSWYMSRLTVAPDNPDTLYTVGQSIHKSTDAGKTFSIIKGAPGGDDYHYLWINPKHPERMITAADQGTVVSVNGGRTWSDWYNQPTGQFYHLAADNRFPYWIYSGQQDSGTVGIASRSDYGAISFRDWHPVGGDERDFDIPDPENPDIVFGSGLGGRISRWDARTGEVQNVSPWPVSSYGARGTDVRYRYTWFTPIAFSARAPYALYSGAQVLFRSLDRGQSWQVISPDLTGAAAKKGQCDGYVPVRRASACGFGVIFAITPSPSDNDEIWIGTDNGRIQLTRDAGASWTNVTPKGVPDWAKISSIDVSALDAGTAYASIDNHRQDDFRPRILRTRDHGKTWTEITTGLPEGHYVSVVRADPLRRGLLYAGADNGVFVSFDDGAHWQSLQRNLPVAWVRDLLVHDNDLIAATQGRAIWVLDDLSPLRQLDAAGPVRIARLYKPAPAYRLRPDQNRDTPPPADTALGTNPPIGAIIDYVLPVAAQRVRIEIRAADGSAVRRFASDEPPSAIGAKPYFADAWLRPNPRPGVEAGAHRFVWDLRLARPKAIRYDYSIAAVLGKSTPLVPQGPLAVPGDYQVVLVADGVESTQPLTIKPDPRVSASPADLAASLAFSQAIAVELERDWMAHGQVEAVQRQLDDRGKDTTHPPSAKLKSATDAFGRQLESLRVDHGHEAPSLATIGDQLASLATDVEGADRLPTEAQKALLAECRGQLDRSIERWSDLRDKQLAALNAQVTAEGLPPISVPTPEQIALGGDAESKDLP
ncbi:WD40/YVTN/BNR-like repeat-containing protein [Dokdonella immobilis]|uniref:Sortilin N-terminal domain-containing protein n=1 Tax=Dokdonella immobilis TaxID=578942 RepID=A0A1I4Z079_9GAMM|nr:hypothetical protein [Dokdonella immobilis]SFN43662.1 Uncharacterized protein SAMN05216289_12154 [Dokdonella immobilis]